jgi:hypothetical protein
VQREGPVSDDFLPQVAWALRALTKQCQTRGYLALAHLLDLAHQETMDEIQTDAQSEVKPNVVGLSSGRNSKSMQSRPAENKPANSD